MKVRVVSSCLVLAICFAPVARATAQTVLTPANASTSAPTTGSLAGSSPRCATDGSGPEALRAQSIARALRTDRKNAALWNWGWSGAGFAAVGVYGTLGALTDLDGSEPGERNLQMVHWVTAARTLITTIGHTVGHLRIPEVPMVDGCIDLDRATQVLIQVAAKERKARSLKRRAGVWALSVLSLGVLGFGYDEWTRGTISLATAMLTTEIVMFTTPSQARKLVANDGGIEPTTSGAATITVAPIPGGLAIAGSF